MKKVFTQSVFILPFNPKPVFSSSMNTKYVKHVQNWKNDTAKYHMTLS